MKLAEYADLPDAMEPNDVLRAFQHILSVAPHSPPDEVLSALAEMADRQWHTYQLLQPDVRSAVESWLIQNWRNSLDYVEQAGWIAGHLGLQGVVDQMKRSLGESLQPEVADHIRWYLADVKEDVSDPYREMNSVRPKS